jgi:hypothetical protein
MLVAGLMAAGCSSTGPVTSVPEIGRSYLMQERTVPSPDSLVHLTLTENDRDDILVRSTRSVQEIQQFWSVARLYPFLQGPRVSTGPTSRNLWDPDSYSQRMFEGRRLREAPEWPEDFVTLWSRELALVEAAFGAESDSEEAADQPFEARLSKKKLDRLIDRQQQTIRFDAYLFDRNPAFTRLDRPKSRIALEGPEGTEYRPDSLRVGNSVRTMVQGEVVYYRRTSIYFDRSALDGMLEPPTTLRLWEKRPGNRSRSFTWLFEVPRQISAQ